MFQSRGVSPLCRRRRPSASGFRPRQRVLAALWCLAAVLAPLGQAHAACTPDGTYSINNTGGGGQHTKILKLFPGSLSVRVIDFVVVPPLQVSKSRSRSPRTTPGSSAPGGFFGTSSGLSSITVSTVTAFLGDTTATTNQPILANYLIGTFNVSVSVTNGTNNPQLISLTNDIGNRQLR